MSGVVGKHSCTFGGKRWTCEDMPAMTAYAFWPRLEALLGPEGIAQFVMSSEEDFRKVVFPEESEDPEMVKAGKAAQAMFRHRVSIRAGEDEDERPRADDRGFMLARSLMVKANVRCLDTPISGFDKTDEQSAADQFDTLFPPKEARTLIEVCRWACRVSFTNP